MKKEHNVQTIDVAELKKHYDNDDIICLIDVRELSEWQEIHIPKAIHIAKGDLPSKIQKQIPELIQPIFLHCRSGVRSMQAANELLKLGYENVYSVTGGILAWEAAGFPVKTRID